MQNKLKEKINKINEKISSLEEIILLLNKITGLCQSINLNDSFLDKKDKEIIKISEYSYNNIILDLNNIFRPFMPLFFDNIKIINSSESDKKALISLSYELKRKLYSGVDPTIIVFKLFGNINDRTIATPEYIKDKIDLVITFLSQLTNIKSIELNKDAPKAIQIKISRDLDKANICIEKLNTIFDYLDKAIISSAIKLNHRNVKTKILEGIKNKCFVNHHKEIQETLFSLEFDFEKNNISMEFIYGINYFVYDEMQKLNNLRQIQEKNLPDEFKTYDSNKKNKPAEIYLKKFEEFQDKRNLSEVYSNARNPNTAILHLEIGRELQVYFSKSDTEELNNQDIDFNENVISKQKVSENHSLDVNHWFKYGNGQKSANESKPVKNLTTTTFGVSLDKLLEDNNIDPEVFSKYKKKKS